MDEACDEDDEAAPVRCHLVDVFLRLDIHHNDDDDDDDDDRVFTFFGRQDQKNKLCRNRSTDFFERAGPLGIRCGRKII